MENRNQPNSGVLFSRKTKTNPKAPDYSGDVTIDIRSGTPDPSNPNLMTFRLAGWKRMMRSGDTFLSLAISTYQSQNPAPQAKESSHDEDPFS